VCVHAKGQTCAVRGLLRTALHRSHAWKVKSLCPLLFGAAGRFARASLLAGLAISAALL